MDRQQTLRFNETNIAEFRASGGRIGSFGDAPVLLLTTIGAKSGRRRTSPVMYLADEHEPNRVFVFASAAGADSNPAWYYNLSAHPEQVEVEIDTASLPATAEILPQLERDAVYSVQAQRYPGFAQYQANTDRPIPVIALHLHRPAELVPSSGGD